MSRVAKNHYRALAFGALASVLASVTSCGRTSLSTFQSESTEAGRSGSGARAGTGGRSFGGASSAGTSSGGTFGTSGATSVSGAFGMAGMAVAGTTSGGQPGALCELSPSDCRTEGQIECELSNFLCEGKVSYRSVLSALENAHIVDVKTERNGRVAIAGYYEGALQAVGDPNGSSQELISYSTGVDAFVASYTALGVLEWVKGLGADGTQTATGIAFAPNGEIVVQGTSQASTGAPGAGLDGFVARLATSGGVLWSYPLIGEGLAPADVAVDNDGITVLVGSYHSNVGFRDLDVTHNGSSTYLLRVEADGTPLVMTDYAPANWGSANAPRLVVDDEDNVIIAGNGTRGGGTSAGFLTKLTPAGEVVFEKEFAATGPVRVGAVTVDREMRVTVGGNFTGIIELDTGKLESLPQQDESVWLAQYGRVGNAIWGAIQVAADPSMHLRGLSADPLGNLLIAGNTTRYVLVRKLRSGGSTIWQRSFATTPTDELAVASDNDARAWVAGSFQDSFDWGDATTPARGTTDAFLMRLTP